MDKLRNYKIISAPTYVMGISLISWFLIMGISAVFFNILTLLNIMLPLLALVASAFLLFILYVFMKINTMLEPDYTLILFTRIIKIGFTINREFKGNRYVV